MAKKAKKQTEEIIPEGMSKKDYADKAFRKKVTIINSCILLAFIIGVVAVIGVGWYNTNQEKKRIEAIETAYFEERDAVLAELKKIEENGGSHEDKSQVKIEVTDDNFSYWIAALDESYQTQDADKHAIFGGAEIHLQGMFYTKKFDGGVIQYWVYRNHSHEEHENNAHEHSEGEITTAEMIPIEVIFQEEIDAPSDGTWVDIVGIVGPDSTKNLSGVRDTKMTLMDEPGQEYVE